MFHILRWSRGLLCASILLLISGSVSMRSYSSEQLDSPLKRIFREGVIRIALEPNSIDYFLHKGHPTGYQLELASRFAQDLGVLISIVPVTSSQDGLLALQDGRADLYAPSTPLSMAEGDFLLSKRCDADCLAADQESTHCAAVMPNRWIFAKSYPDLLQRANQWLERLTNSRLLSNLQMKYGRRGYMHLHYDSVKRPKLSRYDSLIKKTVEGTPWDWRWVASLIYQESRFQPGLTSPQGAYGLMQFMPSTAAYFGVPHLRTPEKQIEAGVQYLNWLDDQFAQRGIPPENRVDFVLAAYNAGLGKILKARKRAEALGLSPNVWPANVALCVSKRKVTPEEIKKDQKKAYGYGETCSYVKQIKERFEHYRNILA